MDPFVPKPVIMPSGSGQELAFIGVTHKLTGQQNGGGYYLFEFTFGPESGNRLHVHAHEDEVVFVIEGAIEIRLGGEKFTAQTGGVAHLPKQIPHALRNPLKTPSKYLGVAIPGGMEKFFDALAAAEQAGKLDDRTHREISALYGIEWLE